MSYGSRKFLLALLVIAIGTAMNWFGKLSPELVDLMKWVGGLYFGFNVTQNVSQWVSTKLTLKEPQ